MRRVTGHNGQLSTPLLSLSGAGKAGGAGGGVGGVGNTLFYAGGNQIDAHNLARFLIPSSAYMQGFYIDDDGVNVIYSKNAAGAEVGHFALSTPGDLNTATLVSSVAVTGAAVPSTYLTNSMQFNDAGTHIWLEGGSVYAAYQLAAPWDITTPATKIGANQTGITGIAKDGMHAFKFTSVTYSQPTWDVYPLSQQYNISTVDLNNPIQSVSLPFGANQVAFSGTFRLNGNLVAARGGILDNTSIYSYTANQNDMPRAIPVWSINDDGTVDVPTPIQLLRPVSVDGGIQSLRFSSNSGRLFWPEAGGSPIVVFVTG